MAYRRDDTLVSLFCMFDEIAIAMLHFLLDDATPAKSMIRELAIPLVVVESDFTLDQHLLGRLALGPGFGAHQIVRFAFHRRIVPGIEQLARIATFRHAFSLSLLHSLACRIVVRFSLIFRGVELLDRIIHRY